MSRFPSLRRLKEGRGVGGCFPSIGAPLAGAQSVCLWVVVLGLLMFLTGCPGPEKPPPVQKPPVFLAPPEDLPRFSDDMFLDGLAQAASQSLIYLNRIPEDRMFRFGDDEFTAAHLIQSLERLLTFINQKPAPGEIDSFIRNNYRVYKSAGRAPSGKVLFTGYFEPLLKGSRTPQGLYKFPVYGRPENLVTAELGKFSDKYKGEKLIGRVSGNEFIPFHDREAIMEGGALVGKAEVLAWVDNRVDLFFLHIQGSGKIVLDNGEVLNVHYNAKNGRPYRSIGQRLIDEDKVSLEDMSMQAIKAYLDAHPEDVRNILNHNPSFVFFSLEKDGPYGALNVRLTPGRSIAVDRSLFPMSSLAFIQTQKPLVDDKGRIVEWRDFSRFVLIQDTGGAIKGPGRVDLFWGGGSYAEIAAGHSRHNGDLYVLVLKPEGGQ